MKARRNLISSVVRLVHGFIRKGIKFLEDIRILYIISVTSGISAQTETWYISACLGGCVSNCVSAEWYHSVFCRLRK